jgi:hypothetical protein
MSLEARAAHGAITAAPDRVDFKPERQKRLCEAGG